MELSMLKKMYSKVRKNKEGCYNSLIQFVDDLDERSDIDDKDDMMVIDKYITEYIRLLREHYELNNTKIFSMMEERDEIQKKINVMCDIFEKKNGIVKENAEK